MRAAQPRDGEERDAGYVQSDTECQTWGNNSQFEPPEAISPGDKGDHWLGAAAVREGGPAIDPPPRAGILVDVDLLAGWDPKDEAVRAPEDRPDGSRRRP
jgi:hypothetical protein